MSGPGKRRFTGNTAGSTLRGQHRDGNTVAACGTANKKAWTPKESTRHGLADAHFTSTSSILTLLAGGCTAGTGPGASVVL